MSCLLISEPTTIEVCTALVIAVFLIATPDREIDTFLFVHFSSYCHYIVIYVAKLIYSEKNVKRTKKGLTKKGIVCVFANLTTTTIELPSNCYTIPATCDHLDHKTSLTFQVLFAPTKIFICFI